MTTQAHKIAPRTRTQPLRPHPFVSTGNAPRKGKRIPLKTTKCNEQRDEETGIVYCDTYQPHAPRRIKDTENQRLYDLQWDRAGNLGQCNTAKDDGFWLGSMHLFWTADCCGPRPCGANRMHAAVDADNYSYYTYDYTGERTLKLTGRNSEMDVNAELQHTSAALDRPTLYPSPYLVMGMHGYTNVTEVESRASSLALPRCSNVTERKHYYAGTERICAKTGGGFGESITKSLPDLQAAADSLFSQSRENIRCRELLQNDMECVASYGHVPDAEMNVHLYEMPSHFRSDAEIHLGEFHRVVEWCEHGSEEEDDVFFYHSDHLGSASWITDAQGDAIQHLQYLPFGEPFVDQRISGYSERFRFTGKERDEETGYGYFGARYMDHELMTMWLSIDPMSDKYPSISPYAYCAWNPVKLVDPDGNDWYQNELTGCIYYNSKVKGADAAGTGAMKGEGWKYLGTNGMFSTDGLHNSDWDIVRRNNGKMNYNEWTKSFDLELSLDGDKAKSVMKSVGYQQVPTQVITYNDTYTQDMPGLQGHTFHLTYGNEYEYAEKIAYIPDSYWESGRSIVGKTEYGKYDPFKNSMPYANRQTIRYSETSTFVKVLGAIFSGLERVHGGHHDYVDKYNMGNISNYRGGNVLIDRILAR